MVIANKGLEIIEIAPDEVQMEVEVMYPCNIEQYCKQGLQYLEEMQVLLDSPDCIDNYTKYTTVTRTTPELELIGIRYCNTRLPSIITTVKFTEVMLLETFRWPKTLQSHFNSIRFGEDEYIIMCEDPKSYKYVVMVEQDEVCTIEDIRDESSLFQASLVSELDPCIQEYLIKHHELYLRAISNENKEITTLCTTLAGGDYYAERQYL
ncbi:hypothetical protein EJP02_090 [Escherichia phage EJP2]|nr:hypothetical protein EJP02_090 [Escherichia phage EJP2]